MPPAKALNVLVYAGSGTAAESVQHCLYTLRRLLSPHFAVSTVAADVVLKEPWMTTCALFVMPGGADLPYCKVFNGEGNRKISQYVRQGGSFIGFCAGGYYGSKRCEFEVGNGELEVVGNRELGFFPGTCRGAAFRGFEYASEKGARAPKLAVEEMMEEKPYSFRPYFNGGGVFTDAEKFQDRGVEILASYEEDLDVEAGEGKKAAIVYCKVGDGGAILTGPHPEFVAALLNKDNGGPKYREVLDAVTKDEEKRIAFMKAMLAKLGLEAPKEASMQIPRLSRIHLTSMYPSDVGHLVDRLKNITTVENTVTKIFGENDTWILEKEETERSFSTKHLEDALPEMPRDDFLDYNKVPKHLRAHGSGLPSVAETPHFDHAAFYGSLAAYRSKSNRSPSQFGSFMLYGETVTSTNTMLDKNPKLLQNLPSGFTFTATTQVAGRGRGSNEWVSPKGSMMFSTFICHPQDLNIRAPVIILQYIVGLAVIEGIKSYEPGYGEIPVRLKWPNDIYARDPANASESYVKIGGILVNSTFSASEFRLVVGVGLNMHNAAPTTSVSQLLSRLNAQSTTKLPDFKQEKLLARILVTFEEMYYRFCYSGWQAFEETYYKHWLHTDQIVTLETEGGIKARVKGVTRDYGLLRVEELGTGKEYTLQSDGNSFDFFKGLLKRKT